jgi:hypothetical protein
MKTLENLAGGPEFDVSSIWARLAIDNIFSTSFGINKDVQNDETNELMDLLIE